MSEGQHDPLMQFESRRHDLEVPIGGNELD